MTPTRIEPSERFAFANQLRGFAAVCVVINHLTGVYWSAPQLVADTTFSALQTGRAPSFSWIAAGSWYNLGPFGVAIFFLISGFVIPMSLERQGSGAFLIARAYRIYPTYFIALGVETALVACSALYWHHPITYNAKLLVANALLIPDILNVPSIDLVNWTLTVELKFYLLIAVVAKPLRRGKLTVVFTLALFILLVSKFSHAIFVLLPSLGIVLRVFESNALYILFMLIGVVFSLHVRARIANIPALVSILVLFALFVACWPLTFFRGEYPAATLNYGWGLLVFGSMYLLRRHVGRWRIAQFFAAISFPLYLVHALVGFTVLQVLTVDRHVEAGTATIAAIAVAIGLAFAIHRTVEKPSQRFGKRLAASLTSERWIRRDHELPAG